MKASAIANSDVDLLAARKKPLNPSCRSSGEHGASLHNLLLCNTHLAHLFSPLYGINVAKTSLPLPKSFCLFVIFIRINFAAKVRNLREKTSGMDAKKLCVGSNWLIYSHKKKLSFSITTY